ncbi:HemK2/MTQ2 family protein methyltransferase [Halobellus captivus]|uniref:HemK2/MTQ2 family protein methyltransferase n=1 Tax=Halobellus captivus TaxID=2592614 RepID=UPI0011A65C35|nr:HemK2/MTQ2 family protein methyltransferase [Halobellus captivus]
MSDETKRDLAGRRGVETSVYQPAEDSRLLSEAIGARGRGRLLEVGTGSGWVASQAVSVDAVSAVVASDVNPHACRAARERALEPRGSTESRRAEVPRFDVVRADLLAPFVDDAFDTVAFNPPYLPTDPDNEWDDWMERALSGGESGRELIDPFLDSVGRALAPDGVVLLLVSSLTGFDAVVEYAEARGFDREVVVEESYPFETLSVLALTAADGNGA